MTPKDAFTILRQLYSPKQRWSEENHQTIQLAIRTLNMYFADNNNGELKVPETIKPEKEA